MQNYLYTLNNANMQSKLFKTKAKIKFIMMPKLLQT